MKNWVGANVKTKKPFTWLAIKGGFPGERLKIRSGAVEEEKFPPVKKPAREPESPLT